MGDALDFVIKGFIIMLIVAVPLAIWKVVDIILWLIHNVNIEIG